MTDHCLMEIITHLEDYSTEELNTLPKSLCRDLLSRLPIPDLCKLEGTSVTDGVNMEEVWYAKCLLDVNIYVAENVDEKSPARYGEYYGTRQEWNSGYMSNILPTDCEKKSWREYYFCSRFEPLSSCLHILATLHSETIKPYQKHWFVTHCPHKINKQTNT